MQTDWHCAALVEYNMIHLPISIICVLGRFLLNLSGASDTDVSSSLSLGIWTTVGGGCLAGLTSVRFIGPAYETKTNSRDCRDIVPVSKHKTEYIFEKFLPTALENSAVSCHDIIKSKTNQLCIKKSTWRIKYRCLTLCKGRQL